MQNGKIPSLSIYWVDTMQLLTYRERKSLEQNSHVICVTPLEVLLEDRKTGRKVAIRGVTDAFAPVPVGTFRG